MPLPCMVQSTHLVPFRTLTGDSPRGRELMHGPIGDEARKSLSACGLKPSRMLPVPLLMEMIALLPWL